MKKQKENSHEGITWSEMGNKALKLKRSIWLLLTRLMSYFHVLFPTDTTPRFLKKLNCSLLCPFYQSGSLIV